MFVNPDHAVRKPNDQGGTDQDDEIRGKKRHQECVRVLEPV
jgi:hypothetical protein